jgi:serine/threonine-protein kinase
MLPGTIYRVIKELGQGGMGRVYEVEDTTIGKRYALKVLFSAKQRDANELLRRMKQESRTLALLSHPNIVDVITAGALADGTAYYVMALLTGSPLSKILLRRKRLEPLEVVEFAIDVAEALEKAHLNGIVHRDVKPDNIFIVVRENMTTQGILVDFGVAGMLHDLRAQYDERGRLLGTPRYAAPEQQRGEAPTPRMDTWSFGMTLFEAIVGHGPFKGHDLPTIIRSVQGPEPAARIRDFLPEVPPPLDIQIARMLEKDPEKRPEMTRVPTALREIQRLLEAQGRTVDENRTWETIASAAVPTSPGDPPVMTSSGTPMAVSSGIGKAATVSGSDASLPSQAPVDPVGETMTAPPGMMPPFPLQAIVQSTPRAARLSSPPVEAVSAQPASSGEYSRPEQVPTHSVTSFVDVDGMRDVGPPPTVRPAAGRAPEVERRSAAVEPASAPTPEVSLARAEEAPVEVPKSKLVMVGRSVVAAALASMVVFLLFLAVRGRHAVSTSPAESLLQGPPPAVPAASSVEVAAQGSGTTPVSAPEGAPFGGGAPAAAMASVLPPTRPTKRPPPTGGPSSVPTISSRADGMRELALDIGTSSNLGPRPSSGLDPLPDSAPGPSAPPQATTSGRRPGSVGTTRPGTGATSGSASSRTKNVDISKFLER